MATATRSMRTSTYTLVVARPKGKYKCTLNYLGILDLKTCREKKLRFNTIFKKVTRKGLPSCFFVYTRYVISVDSCVVIAVIFVFFPQLTVSPGAVST